MSTPASFAPIRTADVHWVSGSNSHRVLTSVRELTSSVQALALEIKLLADVSTLFRTVF